MEALLREIRDEQRKTNQLLAMLIEALGEDSMDDDDEPSVYLSGEPVR